MNNNIGNSFLLNRVFDLKVNHRRTRYGDLFCTPLVELKISHLDRLEMFRCLPLITHNKILRFVCFKCQIPRILHSGRNEVLNFLNIQSWKDRRRICYMALFLNKSTNNNNIDYSFILNCISFNNNPHSTRDRDPP